MIPTDDRSFRFGDGLFETVHVSSDGPVALDLHIARFRSSAEWLGFPTRSVDAGVRALESLAEKPAGLWRVTVSRADESAPFGGSGTVIIEDRPLLERVRRPRLTVARGTYFPQYRLAEHKTTSWIRSVEARRRAIAAGYDDAVMLSSDGLVGEASAANVFVVVDSEVRTPPARGLLPGVTRHRILAAVDGIHETDVTERDLYQATEVILTSAGVGIVAAASLEGRELTDDVARSLMAVLGDA